MLGYDAPRGGRISGFILNSRVYLHMKVTAGDGLDNSGGMCIELTETEAPGAERREVCTKSRKGPACSRDRIGKATANDKDRCDKAAKEKLLRREDKLKDVYSDKVLRAYKMFLGPPYILQIQCWTSPFQNLRRKKRILQHIQV